MIGEKYGKLEVVSLKEKIKNPCKSAKGFVYVYECLCECGTTSFVRKGNLRSGHTTSCGCMKNSGYREKMRLENDMTGDIFGRLTVLERDPEKFKNFICSCSCGNSKSINGSVLKKGYTISCGCFQKEQASERIKQWHKTYRSSLGLDPNIPIGTVEDLERATFKETMQFSILKRDNFCCSWCSETGVYLEVHHLDTWKNSPDKRFDTSNLVTLCAECHKNIHQRDYHKPTDPIMTILLQGFANVIEEGYDFSAFELTPN